ncbi:MAG: addiction module protein [Bacteroidota bacterium]|nr:addiction module protein [Bacteroidota bacterium]
MSTKEIIAEMLSLPIEQRAIVADTLLKSLNAPDKDNDKEWLTLAKKRMEDVKTSKVKLVKGEDVFKKLWKKAS